MIVSSTNSNNHPVSGHGLNILILADLVIGVVASILAILGFITNPDQRLLAFILLAGSIGTLVFIWQYRQHRFSRIIAVVVWAVVIFGSIVVVGSVPATIAGSIIQNDGSPVAGLILILTDASGVDHKTVTDKEGKYEINSVPAGRYTISANGKLLISGAVPLGLQRIFAPYYPPDVAFEITATPTATPIPIATSTPTTTTIPGKLNDIMPQVNGGQEFPYSWSGKPILQQLTEDCAKSGDVGVEIQYDPAQENYIGWGIHWANSPTRHFDASAFKTLTFWVKASTLDQTFDIGLKDTSKFEVKLPSITLNLGSIYSWTRVRIPLTDFTMGGQTVNKNSLDNVNFGFASAGEVKLCIDDIAFVT